MTFWLLHHKQYRAEKFSGFCCRLWDDIPSQTVLTKGSFISNIDHLMIAAYFPKSEHPASLFIKTQLLSEHPIHNMAHPGTLPNLDGEVYPPLVFINFY